MSKEQKQNINTPWTFVDMIKSHAMFIDSKGKKVIINLDKMTQPNEQRKEKDFWTEMNTGEQEKFVLEATRLKKDISFGLKLSTPPHKQTSMEERFDLIHHCARCTKRFCNGSITKKGKHYPAHTVKYKDGTTKQIPATDEVVEALCVDCLKETYDKSFIEKTLETQRREMVEMIGSIKNSAEKHPLCQYGKNMGDWNAGYNSALREILALLQNNLTKQL